MITAAEIGENAAFAVEVISRIGEDAYGVGPYTKRVSDFIKEHRLRYSNWSSKIKNEYFYEFIAGRNRQDTFITATRRDFSEWGNINKSLLSEQTTEVVKNLYHLIESVLNQ